MSDQFVLNGRKLYYTKMGLRAQMKLWPYLAKDVGPAIGKLHALKGRNFDDSASQVELFSELIGDAGEMLNHVEIYFDAFVKQTEVDMAGIATGRHPLATWEEQVFSHAGHVLEFVVRCIQLEFSAFLADLFAKAESAPAPTPTPTPTQT